MLRVRGLTQDDAHLFCTAEQVEHEFKETLGLVKFVLEAVGLEDYRVQLSTRDPNSDKYVGSEELWASAESILRKVLAEEKMPFVESPGDAAFYGPKTDFMVKDCLGREWQLGTVQLDYNLPESVRTRIHRAGQQTSSPCDDSPSAVWFDGTFHWRADRTLRRSVSVVAGTGTDSRVASQREVGRLRV